MSTEENKTIVRRLFDELFNKENPDAANDIIAPDYIDHSPLPAPTPGADGFSKRAVMLRAAFGVKAEFGVFLAEEDFVAFTWVFTGIHSGVFAGIQATGKSISISGINVERLKDGKIIEHWSQFDMAGLMKQIQTA